MLASKFRSVLRHVIAGSAEDFQITYHRSALFPDHPLPVHAAPSIALPDLKR